MDNFLNYTKYKSVYRLSEWQISDFLEATFEKHLKQGSVPLCLDADPNSNIPEDGKENFPTFPLGTNDILV